jgi:hypothetical protein
LLSGLGSLGTVALISLSSPIAFLLALAWGWVLVPHGVAYLRSRSRTPGHASDERGFNDVNTDYWRTTLR